MKSHSSLRYLKKKYFSLFKKSKNKESQEAKDYAQGKLYTNNKVHLFSIVFFCLNSTNTCNFLKNTPPLKRLFRYNFLTVV
jgi:hypothetical protein